MADRSEGPRVRAVVLNYNGGDLVSRCIRHLVATDWPAQQLDIVLVDNDSHDGSDQRVLDEFPQVRLIQSGGNLGFPANNLAMVDRGDCDYVALINNDAFVEPGWLAPLVSALESDPSVGAACARIVFEPRFVDVIVASPTFVPGTSDSRSLGVQVSGVEVAYDDGSVENVFERSQWSSGFWGVEHQEAGLGDFQWTNGLATLRVAVDPPTDCASHRSGETDRISATVRVRLSGPESTSATLRTSSGVTSVDVVVGGDPQWVDLVCNEQLYDVVNNAGSVLVLGGSGADRGYLQIDGPEFDIPVDVFNWCGAGVLFRNDYLDDVGLFDERFFMYYEDTDLSWRARSRGWRHRYVPESRLRHVHAATSGEGSALFTHYVERNRLLMLAKNGPTRLVVGAAGRYVLSTASYARRDVVVPLLRGSRPNPVLTLRRIRAYLGFLRLLPVMLVERHRINARRLVAHEDLVDWMVPQP